MARRPNLIPSVPLTTHLPLPIYTKLVTALYSELEQRVPLGAYSRYLSELIRADFGNAKLDLAPYFGTPSGAMIVQGTPATIEFLTAALRSINDKSCTS